MNAISTVISEANSELELETVDVANLESIRQSMVMHGESTEANDLE